MNNAVIDASALLALLNSEPGADQVAAALGHASISAVNLCETITKLTDAGVPPEEAGAVLAPLGLEVLDFDEDSAWDTALLRPGTKSKGLSLGDRACLALGQKLDATVLTSDRNWADLDLSIDVSLIR